MSCHQRRGNAEVLSAIAAITGQTITDVDTAFHESKRESPDKHRASAEDAEALIVRIKTRLGLAPAVDGDQAADLGRALDSLIGDESVSITRSDLAAWDSLLRHTPEHVPTLDRDPVVIPPLPAHQTEMWKTLLGFEDLGRPWVLVGGQMTMLHCLENGVTRSRPTDDGDIIVGVWTRRDALRETSRFLRNRGFTEEPTSDGYGYRYVRGEKPSLTVVDVLLPEGIRGQQDRPKTTTGRPGLTTPGGNQALTRAQRLRVRIDGTTGVVRRPTLLGSMVAKAHAYAVDSRDKERHAQDLVTLAEIALRDPRASLRGSRYGDRKAVRRFLRNTTPQDRFFRAADDPETVYAFLRRLGNPQD